MCCVYFFRLYQSKTIGSSFVIRKYRHHMHWPANDCYSVACNIYKYVMDLIDWLVNLHFCKHCLNTKRHFSHVDIRSNITLSQLDSMTRYRPQECKRIWYLLKMVAANGQRPSKIIHKKSIKPHFNQSISSALFMAMMMLDKRICTVKNACITMVGIIILQTSCKKMRHKIWVKILDIYFYALLLQCHQILARTHTHFIQFSFSVSVL